MTAPSKARTLLAGVGAMVMLVWGLYVLMDLIYAVFVGGSAWAPVWILGAPWLLIVGLSGKSVAAASGRR